MDNQEQRPQGSKTSKADVASWLLTRIFKDLYRCRDILEKDPVFENLGNLSLTRAVE